ncbi:3-isopropylmalate dehydrogenase [Bienertia sinuspersici]
MKEHMTKIVMPAHKDLRDVTLNIAVVNATIVPYKDCISINTLRSTNMYCVSPLETMDHIKQNKTSIDVHMAYTSDSKNTKNIAFFARIASLVSSLRPPGSVNPAANVIVANKAATTDNVLRISPRFVS